MAPETKELNTVVVEALLELLVEPTRDEPALLRAKQLAENLAALQHAEQVIASERRRAITELRGVGLTLEEIGQLLGMTRQSVHRLMAAPEREVEEFDETALDAPDREPVRRAARTLADALADAGANASVQRSLAQALLGAPSDQISAIGASAAMGLLGNVDTSVLRELGRSAALGLTSTDLGELGQFRRDLALAGAGLDDATRAAAAGSTAALLAKVQAVTAAAESKTTTKEVSVPKKPAIHTVPHGDGWANKREGSSRVSNTATTKAEAQAKGRDMAKSEKTEHIVHNKDGGIGSRNSYGNDPHPPKG